MQRYDNVCSDPPSRMRRTEGSSHPGTCGWWLHPRLDVLADLLDQLVDRVGLEAECGHEQRDVDGSERAGQHEGHEVLQAVDVDRGAQQRQGVAREAVTERCHHGRVEGVDRLLLRRRGVQQPVHSQLVELDHLGEVGVAVAEEVRQAGTSLVVQGVQRRKRRQLIQHLNHYSLGCGSPMRSVSILTHFYV